MLSFYIYFSALFLFFWIYFLFSCRRALVNIKFLDHEKEELEHIPLVTVVIAVKDGEDEIAETVTKLLSSPYDRLELIVVNDRSTDNTGKILEDLKRHFPSLKVVHLDYLEPGWLGKVHALKHGTDLARGDLLLLMDADIHLDKSVLSKAINSMNRYQLDHLAVLPNLYPVNFVVDVILANSTIMFIESNKPWKKIEERHADSVRGVGAFNLFRRKFFMENTPGFSWIKMDIVDDVALAKMIALNQGRTKLMFASEKGPSLAYYNSFMNMVMGFEKNFFAGMANYRYGLMLGLVTFLTSLLIIPLSWIFLLEHREFQIMGGLYLFCNLIMAFYINQKIPRKVIYYFLMPIGQFMMGIFLLRSALVCLKNNGVKWRGTHYPYRELKNQCRVKFKF